MIVMTGLSVMILISFFLNVFQRATIRRLHGPVQHRETCEESLGEEESSEEPTPLTSGLSSSIKRSRERQWEVIAKRPRWYDDSDSD